MMELENENIFIGNSPFVNYEYTTLNEKKGGNVRIKKEPILQWILLGVIVVLCIYILYNTYMYFSTNETYNQRMTKLNFNNLHGEEFDESAQLTIEYGENITNPRAIDHYRLGTVYLFNANDPYRAHNHFNMALNQVINGQVNIRDAPFILDRIDDYKDEFVNFPDINDLPIEQALLIHYNQVNDAIKNNVQQKKEINKDDPEFTQKVILSQQKWESDSQNVHDSTVSNTIQSQYFYVRDENSKIDELDKHNYNDFYQWINKKISNNMTKYGEINKVLVYFNHNYPINAIPNTTEQDLVTTVWQRIHDKRNSNNYVALCNALCDSLCDCIEGGYVVCMTGRNAKIWQTLAHLDFNPKIGIIKNKQILRNEVFESAAKIVDDFIGINGSVSDQLKESYQKGEENEQVEELIESMKLKIDELRDKYRGLIAEDKLNLLIEECKSVI